MIKKYELKLQIVTAITDIIKKYKKRNGCRYIGENQRTKKKMARKHSQNERWQMDIKNNLMISKG